MKLLLIMSLFIVVGCSHSYSKMNREEECHPLPARAQSNCIGADADWQKNAEKR